MDDDVEASKRIDGALRRAEKRVIEEIKILRLKDSKGRPGITQVVIFLNDNTKLIITAKESKFYG